MIGTRSWPLAAPREALSALFSRGTRSLGRRARSRRAGRKAPRLLLGRQLGRRALRLAAKRLDRLDKPAAGLHRPALREPVQHADLLLGPRAVEEDAREARGFRGDRAFREAQDADEEPG